MKIVGDRLRSLREGLKISQIKAAEIFKVGQSSINRYENGQSSPPFELLLEMADYYDVSLDYIFGRTDNPQGTQYEFRPKVEKSVNPETKKFIEMCFDPTSPISERLKEMLCSLMDEEVEE